MKHTCAAAHDRLSADGLRVLAVAYRWLAPRDSYSRADEADLVLTGFVSFTDPVLPNVAEVPADLERDASR
jgi:magnesium-transporting ATPase (P-type)